ncbi:MAG: SPOR domain-containing protein, partial [Deltaproteobacteria bacterium]|nr:SPOR domain-containing protein [Deltaproteobacteria bacterium]
EYWRILNKRRFIVVVTAVVLGVFSTAFAVLRAPVPAYTSRCSIKFEKETTVEGLYAKTLTWSGGDDIETQLAIIKSYAVFEKVAEKMGLIPRGTRRDDNHLKSNIVQIVESLQARVKVTRESFTNILHIEVTDNDPAFAQKLANTIAVTYKELHSEQQMKRTTEAIKYIDDQLKNVREKLRAAEDDFNRFTQQNQLISIDLQSEKLLARAQAIQTDISKQRDDRRDLESVLGQLEAFVKNPGGEAKNFHSSKANAQYQAANDALVSLMLKRTTLLEDYTPRHPEVVEISRRIVEDAKKMLYLLKLQVRDMEIREGERREEVAEVERKTNLLMEKKLEFDRLKRKVDLYNDMTALLERKNQEALIRQAEKPEEITIVKPALLPSQPINPPKTATTGAMGVVIGLVLGLVAAFIVETFDTSLGAIEDVEETLGTQVLGVIPYADPKEIYESIEEKDPEKAGDSPFLHTADLVSHFSPKSMIAESFRALRTNIQFKDAEKKLRTLAITSASPQEGKTLCSINVAITMAQAGMKTLLVGSDMRKPMLSRVFGVEASPGLTDILLGNHPWRDTVKTITDIIMGKMSLDEVMMTPGLDNLHIITAGSIPPNPTVLIESGRLREFMEEAQKEYDLIIFDSPPILSTADAVVLGGKVDGVLLVYRVGSVSRGLLKRAATQLKQVKCNILGVILNGMKPEISPDFQDFKYYKYYYSYGEEGKEKKQKTQKKGFSLIMGRRGDTGREQKEEKDKEDRGQRRTGTRKLILAGVALACLAAGILWQSNLLLPPSPVGMRESPAGKKTSPVPKKAPAQAPAATASPGVDANKPEPPADVTPQAEAGKVTPPPPVAEKESAPEPATPQVPPMPRPEQIAKQLPGPEALVKPPAGTAPPVVVSPTPFSLYLGSFHSLDQARRAISTYSEKGISPYWVRVDLGEKGVWWRIFAGQFKNQEEAEKFGVEKGITEAVPKRLAYAVLTGVFAEPGEATAAKGALEGLGYSPYTLPGGDGKIRLLVGAYMTEEGAKQEAGELKTKGIEGTVVKR